MDTANVEAILQTLDRLQTGIDGIRAIVNASKATPAKVPTRKSKIAVAESLPANQLGPIDIANPEWPNAVANHMIVTKPAEKQLRAMQITRLLGNFSDNIVLDVGCGSGHIAAEIAKQAELVVGYDDHDSWQDLKGPNNLQFTTNRAVVEAHQYDAIVAYDVLDHLVGTDPVQFMTWLHTLLAPGGVIFMRTHPWTARHGGHLYECGHNKAFMHLALTADELAQLDINMVPNLRLNRPMAAYEHIFKEACLKITERKAHTEPISTFFSGAIMDRIVKTTWKNEIDHGSALKIMANSFIDYKLMAD